MSATPGVARPRVVVGVSGGVAAYKALEVVRLLAEAGMDVHCIPTLSALRFVGEASFAALSGNRVHTDIWADTQDVPHIHLGRSADVVVVVPATADLMARATAGMADDLLTATLLTATCPVIFAPAMHTEMWNNPATVANVATLRDRGYSVLEPAVGRLTGVDSGKGRLPDPAAIATAVIHAAFTRSTAPDMAGKHVVVTAGGTREAIDPVRFIGNRSSGRQGYALAAIAALRGARVTLISANSSLADPAGVDVVRVETAAQMQDVLADVASRADAVVMAAAISDFKVANPAASKIKKQASALPEIALQLNPDLLKELVARRRPGQVIVGFAAETGDAGGSVREHGMAKLADKGCDVLVINDVSAGKGFETVDNAVTVVTSAGTVIEVPLAKKELIADTVWNVVTAAWRGEGS